MLTCNGLTVASMHVVLPWSGVWTADLELVGDVVPSGKVAIASTDGIAMVGTVVANRSGEFAEKRHVRVLGGGGGWGKPVRAQHYHSAANVLLATVVSTTATEAGEAAVILAPKTLGTDFTRLGEAPAAAIFAAAGVDWWVGFDGVTRVAPKRPPAVPSPTLEIVDWDQATSVATFRCDVIPEPGTPVVDPRFGTAARYVRTVEAKVSGGSVTGNLQLELEVPKAGTNTVLADAVGLLATRATRAEFGRFYEYRVIAMAGDAVELQAIDRKAGIPDILPASVWSGMSGLRAVLRPASKALVGFIAGDPKRPYVAAFEPPDDGGWRPVKLEVDALTLVVLGVEAAAQPVARAPSIVAFAEAVASAWTSAAAGATALGVPVAGPALAALLAPLAQSVSAASKALAADSPSKKVVAS